MKWLNRGEVLLQVRSWRVILRILFGFNRRSKLGKEIFALLFLGGLLVGQTGQLVFLFNSCLGVVGKLGKVPEVDARDLSFIVSLRLRHLLKDHFRGRLDVGGVLGGLKRLS
jgi:hypothetical protein